MKKRNLILSMLAFCAMQLATAQIIVQPQQCQGICQSIDMNIGPPGGNPTNPNWSFSHGSPTLGSPGFWVWSYNNNGEGINFSGFNFIAGQQYCISYLATTSTHDGSPANAAAAFNIVATNGPVVGMVVGAGGAPIPPVPGGSQVVHNKPWSTFSGGGQVGNTEWVSFTFTASNNFNNLWFYPSSPTLPQVEISITQMIICVVEPCKVNFSVNIGQYSATQSTITIDPYVPPGYYFCNMDLYRNGILVYSGAPVSYIAVPGNYRVCVTFCNKATGQRCTKCFEFCIGKWTSFDTSNPNDPSDPVDPSDPPIEFPVEPKSQPTEIVYIPEFQKERPTDGTLNIAPNPSKGEFRVTADPNSVINTLEIYNTSGVLVKTIRGANGNMVNVALDYAPGIYVVKAMMQDGKVINSKIVIE